MSSLLCGIAQKLLGELRSPDFQIDRKNWGSETEFCKLDGTLSSMLSGLVDLDEKKITNHEIEDWLKRIKIVFYDVEDLLQEMSTESVKRQVMMKKKNKSKKAAEVRLFFSSSNQFKYRLKIGRKVKLITKRLDAIASDYHMLSLNEQRQEEIYVISSKRKEETYNFVPAEKVVGREEDRENITQLLLHSDAENVSVISIVGIGGIGKTTLAQLVYNLEEVKGNFERRIWVTVSNVFDVKMICEQIVVSATGSRCRSRWMDGVMGELKTAIDGRKYLLVLDDVCNQSPIEWLKLEDLLAGGGYGTKILITARSELVARAARSTATYSLKGLSHEDSWSLLKQVAFVDPSNQIIEEIGEEIVEKCAGVPSAIKTIGSNLDLEVKLIRESLDAIASDHHMFSLNEQRREEMHVISSKREEETHSFVPAEKVVGRDEDREIITQLLLHSDAENVSVISIVGIGGIGKTTLAQLVYNSEEVKGNFELRMWVTVSNVFDVKMICEQIVESATGSRCRSRRMDGVMGELKIAIDGRKYLLVLDDVCNQSPIEWLKLEDLLAGGGYGTKILITAQSELVARAARSTATHFLKGLSYEDSWSLLKQVAFVDPSNQIIEEIGEEIVEKCAGVPSAIKTIGSNLDLEVKLIRESLDAIASDHHMFSLNEQRQEEMHVISSKREEETHSFVPAEKVVGRDEDREIITQLLLHSDAENVSVISIVGIGGIGKTTLAQLVYNLEEVKGNFELRMWVTVSNVFDVKMICEQIVESATGYRCRSLQMDVVMGKLKTAIDGRKYLLVLDDVCNQSPIEWLKLEDLLAGGGYGTKILITARSELVARAAHSTATHFLKGLSHEDSWSLLKQVAFVDPSNQIIKEIGEEIVEKCAGVPSAIKTIGSNLDLEVKLIRESLDAIASDHHMFSLNEQRQEEMHVISSKREEETHSFVPAEKVVGRQEDREIITQLLLHSDAENVSVISIVGIGGIGKTTLAQLVYNSEEVKGNFELRMWVMVSNPFDLKMICEKIIQCAAKIKCERLPMFAVKDILINAISGKRYLLVLDDVWNESATEWTKLKDLLMGGARGSMILITARSELVARVAGSTTIHSLKGLSREESWTLFKQVAFKQKVEPESSTIIEIGKVVVEKCARVPLAIMIVGSLLGQRESESDWLDFAKNDLPRISQDSNGGIVPILRLSYDSLSASLKRCFVYCAVFPKDSKIYRTTLVWLWMAQGLIPLNDRTSVLEDVGEEYFRELLMRSFFEDCETDETGDVFCCRMQNLIYDLVQSIDGNESCVVGSDGNVLEETTRHAWVSVDIPTSLFDATKLRTLVVRTQVNVGTCNEIVSRFKQMRVLDMALSKLTSVPHFVGGLSHLYYLDLSENTFASLPESICSLYNLQTLILASCKNLTELPKGTKNLVRLRHLDVTGCSVLRCMPRGFGQLTSLQTLSDFVMGVEDKKCGQLIELKSLVNLRGTVTIRNVSACRVRKREKGRSCYPGLLTDHKFIEYLWLEWSLGDKVEVEEELLLFESLQPHPNLKKLYLKDYGGMRFPSWMDNIDIGILLPNIVYIGITNCKSCGNLPPFGLLPSLDHLFLWNLPHLEYIYDEEHQWDSSTSTGSLPSSSRGRQLFPSLKKLDLFRMPRLVGLGNWRRTREVGELAETSLHFPVLEELYICSCPLFVPHGSEEGKQFQNLSSLRTVYVYNSVHNGNLLPGIQYLPNLHSLTLDHCEYMVTFPDWMGSLTSVREIHLKYCESLASIPNYFQHFSSLKRLLVRGCPLLRMRCQKETGDDWPYIAHIPYISLW